MSSASAKTGPALTASAKTFSAETLAQTVADIRACRLCEQHLPLGPNPIVQAMPEARIVLVSQAPGSIAHRKTLPYQDPSGVRLRDWLGVTEEEFYESGRFVIFPMGFCYPGKQGGGDAPPRPECAPAWHERLWRSLPPVDLTVLIGAYAQKHYLGKTRKKTLTATVQAFEEYLPTYLPIPHPSPRNNIWMRKNAWFEERVVPELRRRVRASMKATSVEGVKG